MSKEDCIEVTGTVVEKFPSGLFSVQLDAERTVLAHLAGKLRRNRIRVLAGDRVTLELSPYDLTKGRITYRHKYRPRRTAPEAVTADGPIPRFWGALATPFTGLSFEVTPLSSYAGKRLYFNNLNRNFGLLNTRNSGLIYANIRGRSGIL